MTMIPNSDRRSRGNKSSAPPLLHNQMQVEQVPISALRANPESARRFGRLDEVTATRIIGAQPLIMPVLANRADGMVIIGGVVYFAAQQLGIAVLPVIWIDDMTAVELQALSVAYQRLGELGEWDRGQLAALHLRFEVELPDYVPENIGFEVGAIDLMIGEQRGDSQDDAADDLPPAVETPVTQLGDVWLLGKHRIICGDSTNPSTFGRLMAGSSSAAMVFSDPPFGCKVNGFVSREGQHREFVMGSGDMSPDELSSFFSGFIAAMLPHLKAGAVVEIVIDWRSLQLLLNAAVPHLGPLINLAVWAKDRPGQGSWLRSQHELILMFKIGKGRARNNVQLGRYGRNRTNLWSYPSAKTASKGSDEGDMLQHHPTPKPVRLVTDAMLDCTRRGDIVIDAFLGSGTTLIAAEKVGRVCHAAELDPLYVDLAVRRWQAWTGEAAAHQGSGRTFAEVAADIALTL